MLTGTPRITAVLAGPELTRNIHMIRSFLFLVASVAVLSLASCSGDDSTSSNNNGTPISGNYFPLTAGSNWTYIKADSTTYDIVILGDSIVDGKTYTYTHSTDMGSEIAFRR